MMMEMTGVDTAQAVTESLTDWWAIAGVGHAVSETPVNWLAPGNGIRAVAPLPSVTMDNPPSAASGRSVFPDTLEAFHHWLAQDASIPETGWPQLGAHVRRILPTGSAAPSLMVIADFPDADDLAKGELLSGEAGRLFDAMLAAIGQSRDSIYLAALAVARPTGGLLADGDSADLAERMRNHIGLVGPQRLILLGDKTSRALLPTTNGAETLGLRPLNLIRTTVDAISIAHPRFLLKHPSAKAQCWQTMQFLLEAKA